MYGIFTYSSQIEKSYKRLMKKLSPDVQKSIIEVLSESPRATRTYGVTKRKIEKKGKLWQLYITGGDRIIYDVLEKPKKIVLIHFAGNHNEASRFLKNN